MSENSFESAKKRGFLPGTLVKLKKLRRGSWLYAELWNQDTDDYVVRNYIHLPEQYTNEWAWSVDHSIVVKDSDVGIFIKRVDVPNDAWDKNPIDIVLINEKMVGIKTRCVNTHSYPRKIRYESRIKHITKRDY